MIAVPTLLTSIGLLNRAFSGTREYLVPAAA